MSDGVKTYALAGCKLIGIPAQVMKDFSTFDRTGHALVSVDYVVSGYLPKDYSGVNRLVSEIEHLREWLGPDMNHLPEVWNTLYPPRRVERAGRISDVAVHMASQRERSSVAPYDFSIRIRSAIATSSYTATSWDSHLQIHSDIKDLISVASLSKVAFINHMAQRWWMEDGALEGRSNNDPVATALTGIDSYLPSNEIPDFLFDYSCIGRNGVIRWLAMRRKYSRGITPFLTNIEMPNLPPENRCFAIGMSMELLYEQARKDRIGGHGRAKDYKDKLKIIASNASFNPPFDVVQWAESMSEAYNGTKHYRSPEDVPKVDQIRMLTRQSEMLVQLWIAKQMRVTENCCDRHGLHGTLVSPR